jgi:hypothetical protein
MWFDIAVGYVVGELAIGGIAVACVIAIVALCAVMEKVRGPRWQRRRR